MAAGMGRSMTPTAFLAMKGGGALVGGCLRLHARHRRPAARSVGVVFAFGLGFGGFVVPGFIVGMRGRKRREEMRAQLPDALDLLAVSVEAGLGFDGARREADRAHGRRRSPRSSRSRSARCASASLATTRSRSWRSARARPRSRASCRAIIQADQLGISLGRLLRVQATDARLKRQAAAEEKAMKSPIKMLFPTVHLHLPGDVHRHPRPRDAQPDEALLMAPGDHEIEQGFGTGLRAQLEARRERRRAGSSSRRSAAPALPPAARSRPRTVRTSTRSTPSARSSTRRSAREQDVRAELADIQTPPGARPRRCAEPVAPIGGGRHARGEARRASGRAGGARAGARAAGPRRPRRSSSASPS